MAQGVRAGWLENGSLEPRLFESSLQYRLVKMMPALLAGDMVNEMTRCWKHPLPAPLFSSIGIFAFKRIGQRARLSLVANRPSFKSKLSSIFQNPILASDPTYVHPAHAQLFFFSFHPTV